MAIPDRAVYPTQPTPLRNQIEKLLKSAPAEQIEGEVVAVVVPDTNRMCGGQVAAEVYRCLEGRQYETVILVAPSHAGAFRRMNICSVDTYRSPLGELAVNDRVRNELCDEDDDIFLDDEGHYHIEGIDVQLPYLQSVIKDFDIVPIVMGDESPEFCRELGAAIGEVMYNRTSLLVATADVLDASEEAMEALTDAFEQFEVSRLMAQLNSDKVRVEGKGPLLVALIAAQHRRARKAYVLRSMAPTDDDPGFIGAVLVR